MTEPGSELDLALLGLVLVATGAALVPVAGHLVRTLVPERRVFFARWGFSHVIGVVLVVVLGLVVLGSVRFTDEPLDPFLRMLAVLTLAAVVAARAAVACEPTGLRSLGFPRGRDPRSLFAAGGAFLFALPLVFGAHFLWPNLLRLLGADVPVQEALVQLSGLEGGALVAGVLLAVLVQPFIEEVLFRGFLQPLLVQNLSDRGGVIVTSLLFALPHGRAAFLGVFVLSLVIGGVMLRTQRLSAAWLVHALNNATALALSLSLAGGEASTP